jgi:hypothetical protein
MDAQDVQDRSGKVNAFVLFILFIHVNYVDLRVSVSPC